MGIHRVSQSPHWPMRPSGPLEIDWENPITRGLIGAWSCADPDGIARNITGRFPNGTVNKTYISPSVTSEGPCLLTNTDTSNLHTDFGDAGITGDMTASIWCRPSQTDAGGQTTPIFLMGQWNSGSSPGTNAWIITLSITGNSGDRTCGFNIEIGTTTSSTAGTTPAWSANQTMFFCAVREQTSLKLYSYINGAWSVVTGTCGTGSINLQPTRPIRIAETPIFKPTNMRNGKFWEPRVWNRALNAGEVYSLFDPLTRWDIYRRPSQRVYAPVFSKARFDDSHQIIGGPM